MFILYDYVRTVEILPKDVTHTPSSKVSSWPSTSTNNRVNKTSKVVHQVEMTTKIIVICVWHALVSNLAVAFTVKKSVVLRSGCTFPKSSCCYAFDQSIMEPSYSSMMLAQDSWRQYVPLVVIAGVLVDILLGSPLANSLLKPLRGDQPQSSNGGEQDSNETAISKSRERIDSDRVAQEAIARAESTLELRRFLDESKSDWDKMQEQMKDLEEQMQDFDADYQAREESFAKQLGDKNENRE